MKRKNTPKPAAPPAPQPPSPPAGDLLTDPQACAFLSTTPRTLRLWRHNRALPFIRISSRVLRYRHSDLEAWLDRARTVIA